MLPVRILHVELKYELIKVVGWNGQSGQLGKAGSRKELDCIKDSCYATHKFCIGISMLCIVTNEACESQYIV